MKVIILAAGRGSRLGERTKDRPKCMCMLQGRTLLDRCLETLDKAGVPAKEIGIVTGYKSEMFTVPDVTYFHNAIWEQTNMFYSLTKAANWLKKETCLVLYSDIVFDVEVIYSLSACTVPLAITSYTRYWELWEKRMENPLDDLETFKTGTDGHLIEIGHRPASKEEIQGQFMGCMRFTPESWEWVRETVQGNLPKPIEKLDMTTLLQEIAAKGFPVTALPYSGLWLECDSEHDIEIYEKMRLCPSRKNRHKSKQKTE